MRRLLSLLLVITMMIIPSIAYATENSNGRLEWEELEKYVNWTVDVTIRDSQLGMDRGRAWAGMFESESIMLNSAGENSDECEEFNTIIMEDNDYFMYSLLYFRTYTKEPFWEKFKKASGCLINQKIEDIGGRVYILTDKDNKVDRGFILKRKIDDNIIERIQSEIRRLGGNSIEVDLSDIKQRRNYKQNWSLAGSNIRGHSQTLTNYFIPFNSIKSEIDKGKKVEIALTRLESETANKNLDEEGSPEIRNLLVVGYIDTFESVIAIDTSNINTTEEIIVMQIRFKDNQEVIVPDLNNAIYKARIVYNY